MISGARFRQALPVVAALVAIALALLLVRSDVHKYSTQTIEPRSVAAGHAVDVAASADADENPAGRLDGTFTLESVRDVAQLVPDEASFEDPVGRSGGRVVLATLSCRCAVSEEFRAPTFYAIDDAGRKWESMPIDTSSYPDLADVLEESDLGELPTVRFASVFVVPKDVADSVDVLIDPAQGESVRLRR